MAAAQILCTKCGSASAEPRADCPKCGGKNALVCGACGKQNSIAKNFCDKCGQPLAELGFVAPPTPTKPPGSPAAEIPSTAIVRLPPAAEGAPFQLPGALPPAASAGSAPGAAPLEDLWAPAPAPKTAPPPPKTRRSAARGVVNALAAAIGLGTAAFGIWRWQETQQPETVVPRLAAEYLEALRGQDYARAYGMFSEAARRSCTLEEFRAFRDTTPWTWSDLRIEHQEPGALLLAYELRAQGAPPRTDHVLFTQEDGRWTRPYDWVLMRRVEDAFARGDADRGLLLAQAAAAIDPRDPMAWGYLCEAAYYRKLPKEVEARCLRALQLVRTYPSSLTMRSLYHLHAILADTYRVALGMPDKTLEQYGEMLAFPGISPQDQCQILLARAQVYRQLSRPGEELADLDRGAAVCAAPGDLAFIQKMREAMRLPP